MFSHDAFTTYPFAIGPILAVWFLRYLIDGHDARHDVKLGAIVLLLLLWNSRAELLRHPALQQVILQSQRHKTLVAYVFSAAALSVLLVKLWLFTKETSQDTEPTQPQPYILPCRTTHTRMFPKKHRFSYSYLQVAVPITNKRTSGIDGKDASRSWLTTDPADYLYRGGAHMTFHQKLQEYLSSQSIDLDAYSSAWLVTAPRFLGYSFNPVSFWYLYQKDRLKSMILEVNNTFDERRMYFMDTDSSASDNASENARPSKFGHTWPKDFHVSPFNSRKGSYALSAVDPGFRSKILQGIDNTITLSSSKSHSKLVARVHSTHPPIDPHTLSQWQWIRFVASWWWVGFFTFPRIVKEAAKLFFQRKLHVWYRPEVLVRSIGRNETRREQVFEMCWRRYLQSLAKSDKTTLHKESLVSLVYIASGSAQPREQIFGSAKDTSQIRFHVLTPQFYSDIVIAPSIIRYLQTNAAGPPEARTFDCDDLESLVALAQEPDQTIADSKAWSWRLLGYIRKQSAGALKGETQSEAKSANALDAFVFRQCSSGQAEAYRKATTTQLLADRLAFGLPVLIDLGVLTMRCGAVYAAMNGLITFIASWTRQGGMAGVAGLAVALEGLHLGNIIRDWLRRRPELLES